MKKVLVIIPTGNRIESETLESLYAQDYPNYDWLISRQTPIKYPDGDRRNTSSNSTRNLNFLKTLALQTDADYFLTLDSDVVLPKNAISALMLQMNTKEIMGGWYPTAEGNRWVAAKWIADNTIYLFKEPQNSVIKVDMVGLGCMMISRKALTDLNFFDGMDKFCKDELGYTLKLGPCLAFGNNATDKGYTLWMDGYVICKHLNRK